MTDDKVADIQTDSVSAGEEDSSTESNHAVYKRQQAEWRKMKHQVAQLKKQRKALNKKQREKKKEISKDIRTLLSTLRLKHEEELKSLGIIPDKNRMDLDMEDDEDLE
jgi:predicted RNase H-like nuclease (RuvC/YqgF family)